MKSPANRPFTLVELLVVIGVISILMSLLMSTLQKALDEARTTQCLGNQRQLGIASAVYFSEHRGYLYASRQMDRRSGAWDPNEFWSHTLVRLDYLPEPSMTQDAAVVTPKDTLFLCPSGNNDTPNSDGWWLPSGSLSDLSERYDPRHGNPYPHYSKVRNPDPETPEYIHCGYGINGARTPASNGAWNVADRKQFPFPYYPTDYSGNTGMRLWKLNMLDNPSRLVHLYDGKGVHPGSTTRAGHPRHSANTSFSALLMDGHAEVLNDSAIPDSLDDTDGEIRYKATR